VLLILIAILMLIVKIYYDMSYCGEWIKVRYNAKGNRSRCTASPLLPHSISGQT
jgi:hypothetical protein